MQQGGLAGGLEQFAVGDVFLPGAAEVGGYVVAAVMGVSFVPHGKEKDSGTDFRNCGLAGYGMCKGMCMPGLAVVLRIGDAGVKGIDAVHASAFAFLVLDGDYQGAVGHRDAAPGALEGHSPAVLLELAGEVYGLAPGDAVVVGGYHHELGSVRDFKACIGVLEAAPAFVPVRPYGEAEEPARFVIDQETGVSDAVFLFRKAAVFAHVHGDDQVAPCFTAVGGAFDANVDIGLQIHVTLVSYVICGDECALFGCYKGGDAETGNHLRGVAPHAYDVAA